VGGGDVCCCDTNSGGGGMPLPGNSRSSLGLVEPRGQVWWRHCPTGKGETGSGCRDQWVPLAGCLVAAHPLGEMVHESCFVLFVGIRDNSPRGGCTCSVPLFGVSGKDSSSPSEVPASGSAGLVVEWRMFVRAQGLGACAHPWWSTP
jgi:hypothetical protein